MGLIWMPWWAHRWLTPGLNQPVIPTVGGRVPYVGSASYDDLTGSPPRDPSIKMLCETRKQWQVSFPEKIDTCAADSAPFAVDALLFSNFT